MQVFRDKKSVNFYGSRQNAMLATTWPKVCRLARLPAGKSGKTKRYNIPLSKQ